MEYIDYVRLMHGDHDSNSQHPTCKVFKALSEGLPKEKVIEIAEEVDTDIRESFEFS